MDPWTNDYKSIQGNIGLGQAIAYYTSKGIPVLVPLNDTQKYDLVVDIDGILNKVSIKTTQQKATSGNFIVGLRNTGGSSGKSKIRPFDNTSSDILFIYTFNQEIYIIPTIDITVTNAITLNKQLYGKYKIK